MRAGLVGGRAQTQPLMPAASRDQRCPLARSEVMPLRPTIR
jgi:hypothetical protein